MTISKKVLRNKDIKDSVKWKAVKLLSEFDGNRIHVVAHCLEMLDTLSSVKAELSVVEFYQQVLYFITRVLEHDGETLWGKCPICKKMNEHDKDCYISIYEGNKTHK